MSITHSLTHSRSLHKRIVLNLWELGFVIRVEEVSARGVLAIREDIGGAGLQDSEAQRPSLGCVR